MGRISKTFGSFLIKDLRVFCDGSLKNKFIGNQDLVKSLPVRLISKFLTDFEKYANTDIGLS